MRRIVALLLAVLCGGAALALVPSAAYGATITTPTGNPFAVPGDAAGNPQPFTVSATGYAPDSNVFIEQCDGTAPTTVGWDPTTNCDLGASPAPSLADASGNVSFPAADPNHGFHPFKGASPQGLFNCLAPTDASPGNGLPDFTNCQVRVSTNNSAGTSDQVFLTMTLPAGVVGTAPGFTGTPPAGTIGAAYSFAFTGITGSPAPTFSMSPATIAGGITISAAGVLSGTPTTAGSFPVSVTAANGVAPDAVKPFTIVIAPANTDVAPDFTGTPSSGTVGAAYSFAFTGITGSPAPTFSVSPATIAGGITISAAGVLSGTPTTSGSFPITVTATNGVAPDAVKQFTIDVAPANTNTPPDFTGTPSSGTVGAPYSFAFTGVTGSPLPAFSVSPATIAGGITISAAGVLSGTPTTSGSFPITVTAANGVAPDAVKMFTIDVAPANTNTPPDFTGTPPAGTVGTAYSFAFTGITGSPAPTFSVSPATIAGGITIDAAGVLSGTPTTSGSFPITVTATNGVAPDAVKMFMIDVAAATTPPDFTGTPPSGMVGAAYSFAFTGITGSPAPTFSVSPATIAGGITIDAAGVLSGTPTTSGSFPITVTATNGVAPDAVKMFTIDIAPANTGVAPEFTGTPPAATAGAVYNFAFSGITGSPGPTFTVDPATIAGGITISPDGVLSGTPTEVGSFPITVTATNGVAPDAVKTFTLVVNPAEVHHPHCPPWLKHRLEHGSWWRIFHEHHSPEFWRVVRDCFKHTHCHHEGDWPWEHHDDGDSSDHHGDGGSSDHQGDGDSSDHHGDGGSSDHHGDGSSSDHHGGGDEAAEHS